MNNQKPSKPTSNPEKLEVHSIFPTIQGEGPFVGQPAIFIRLAGCNLQCPMCDTDYTSVHTSLDIKTIMNVVVDLHSKNFSKVKENLLVVITGGEPFRQRLEFLTLSLLLCKYRVQIETNGTLFQEELLYDHITIVCSPKTGSVNEKLKPYISALKYVVRNNDEIQLSNGLPKTALDHPASPILAGPWKDFKGTIYVQPVDEQDEEKNKNNLLLAIKTCQKYGYTLGIQLHKFIGLP